MELLELTCPTACACLFKLRLGVLSNTLSHIWGKLNLSIFLFNVRLLTSKELVPVGLRLKTTLKTEKARKIMRKAEMDLLQARVKSINSILGDNTKQIELSRSKLASIVSATIMDKCQQFIDKVSKLRFLKNYRKAGQQIQ